MELTPALNSNNGTYELTEFDTIMEQAKQFVEKIKANEDIKSARTELRKKKKEITDTRIAVNKLYFGKFNEQLKSIETLLDNCDKELKSQLPPDNKPKMHYIKVGHYDINTLNKIKEFANSVGGYVKDETIKE